MQTVALIQRSEAGSQPDGTHLPLGTLPLGTHELLGSKDRLVSVPRHLEDLAEEAEAIQMGDYEKKLDLEPKVDIDFKATGVNERRS